jgi:serine/threonine protein kinase
MAAHSLIDPNAITPGDLYQNGRYTVIRQLAKDGQGIIILAKDNQDQIE